VSATLDIVEAETTSHCREVETDAAATDPIGISWSWAAASYAAGSGVRAVRCGDRPHHGKIAGPLPAEAQMISLTLVRTWRYALPEFGRLDLQIQHAKRSLSIRELRCDASDFRDDDWDYKEPGVCVLSAELTIAPQEFSYQQKLLVGASLRALGRRFERGGQKVTDEMIMGELHGLAREHGWYAGLGFGASVVHAVEGAGRYLGHILEQPGGQAVVSLRTYVVGG
jgi:hypothetical protein